MSSELEFDGRRVDLRTDPAACTQLRRLYEQRRRRQKLPLWCVQPHRGHMHLREIGGQLWAAHDPGQGGPGCNVRIPEPEGVPHKNLKEYAAEALDAYPVIPEYSTGNGTRLDLFVDAPFNFGVEAQFSKLSTRDAKARTTKSANAGAPPLWLPYGAPPWLSDVPTIRHNDHEISWESRPPKGSVPAIGLRRIMPAHCTVTGPFNHCPDKRSGFCQNWHPDYQLVTGWTLDDVLVGAGERAVVFHQDRKKDVRVVLADGMPIYLDLTGLTGEFIPGNTTAPRPVTGHQSTPCTADRPIEDDEPLMVVRFVDTFVYGDLCLRCQETELWAPPSITRGLCERCWLDIDRGAKPFQLAFNFNAIR